MQEGVLPEGREQDAASDESEAHSLAQGSFSLRRAHYFNDIWHEKIISHNLRVALVENIAKHYVNRGVKFSYLIKGGNLGLTHALENFEFEGGSLFSNYAARCIRQHIERTIMIQSGVMQSSGASEIMPPLSCR